MREEKLRSYLEKECNGRRNAVKSFELEQALLLSSSELRKLINRLREKGIPIGSGPNGYFYARTAGEVYSTVRQLRKIVKGTERAIHGLEQSLDGFSVGGECHR